MKQHDIEAIMTAKVTEYIAKGYVLSPATMSGHQGEIGKVDLHKGTEVIRILLTNEYESCVRTLGRIDSVMLTVGRVEHKRNDRPFSTWNTIWNDKLEVIEQRQFYQIDERADFFTEDFQEYAAMKQVQLKRLMAKDSCYRDPETELPEAAKQIAVRYIKRRLGKSRVSVNDVKAYKKTSSRTGKVSYCIVYRASKVLTMA